MLRNLGQVQAVDNHREAQVVNNERRAQVVEAQVHNAVGEVINDLEEDWVLMDPIEAQVAEDLVREVQVAENLGEVEIISNSVSNQMMKDSGKVQVLKDPGKAQLTKNLKAGKVVLDPEEAHLEDADMIKNSGEAQVVNSPGQVKAVNNDPEEAVVLINPGEAKMVVDPRQAQKEYSKQLILGQQDPSASDFSSVSDLDGFFEETAKYKSKRLRKRKQKEDNPSSSSDSDDSEKNPDKAYLLGNELIFKERDEKNESKGVRKTVKRDQTVKNGKLNSKKLKLAEESLVSGFSSSSELDDSLDDPDFEVPKCKKDSDSDSDMSVELTSFTDIALTKAKKEEPKSRNVKLMVVSGSEESEYEAEFADIVESITSKLSAEETSEEKHQFAVEETVIDDGATVEIIAGKEQESEENESSKHIPEERSSVVDKLDEKQNKNKHDTGLKYQCDEEINKNSTLPESVKDQEDSDNSAEIEDCLDDSKIRSKKYKNIYVSIVTKSFTTKTGKKKQGRVYDTHHYCLYCEKPFTNFAQHVQRLHKTKSSVVTIMSYVPSENDTEVEKKVKEKKKKNLLSVLRFKGDHEHNLKVLKHKSGEIILGRRFTGSEFDVNKYGPCPTCYEWLKLSVVDRHKCPVPSNTHSSKASLLTQSAILAGRITEKASKLLIDNVFPVMKEDEIGSIARDDDLIVIIGNHWMNKLVGNELNRPYYTSSIMRLCAHLLKNLRMLGPVEKQATSYETEENTLSDYIRPQYFDKAVSAALMCAQADMDDLEELGKPSNAIKIGYELKRIVSVKLGQAIRNRDNLTKEECRDYQHLLTAEWSARVTKRAQVTLRERQFNQEKKMPEPSDLVKLKDYLHSQLEEIDVENLSYKNFQHIAKLTLSKLLSYNRRRSGEIQAIK